MKHLILLALLFTQTALGQDRFETKEKLITTNLAQVEIELNEQTVLCSAADYGASFLKVLIPALADLTIMDHQNTGAGAPCVAAGMCEFFPGDGGFKPTDILDGNNSTELVDIEVSLTRVFHLDHEEKTCRVSLKENVKTTIRGIEFLHQRVSSLGERVIADCL
ncbi:MAG: hypothetical protein KC493_14200 [Bacteriovoracaceae bacterium]|nr:hypothetical protein [Bacteriovoracaceae bacterium]